MFDKYGWQPQLALQKARSEGGKVRAAQMVSNPELGQRNMSIRKTAKELAAQHAHHEIVNILHQRLARGGSRLSVSQIRRILREK